MSYAVAIREPGTKAYHVVSTYDDEALAEQQAERWRTAGREARVRDSAKETEEEQAEAQPTDATANPPAQAPVEGL